MSRINIHVPVDMEDLFLDYKDQINVSQAALRCVKAELEQAKKVAEGLIDTDEMIQRLRMERLQDEDQAFQLGYTEGIKGFKAKSYGEIQAIIEAYLRGDAEGIMDATEKEIEGWDNRSLFEHWATNGLGMTKHQLSHFTLGYGKATKDCWDKIAAQVMA
jgi:hypothetical protein